MKLLLIIIGGLAGLGIAGMLMYVLIVQNIEKPDYTVVKQAGDFELRDYPPLVVAEVQRSGSRQDSLSAGFRPLANYIFAKERGGEHVAMTAPVQQQAVKPDEKIAMTAPVTQTPTNSGEWRVQFIMPAKYEVADLPEPANDAVQLRQIPARRMAAVRFSGRADEALIAEQEQRLRTWLASQALTPTAPPIYAYYNDPFTPGFLRRNEVLIAVTSPASAE